MVGYAGRLAGGSRAGEGLHLGPQRGELFAEGGELAAGDALAGARLALLADGEAGDGGAVMQPKMAKWMMKTIQIAVPSRASQVPKPRMNSTIGRASQTKASTVTGRSPCLLFCRTPFVPYRHDRRGQIGDPFYGLPGREYPS